MAGKDKKRSTKPPTKLKIERNNKTFHFSWDKGEPYDKEDAEYKIDDAGTDKWYNLPKVKRYTESRYKVFDDMERWKKPKKGYIYVYLRVRGYRKKDSKHKGGWSEWSRKKVKITRPWMPKNTKFELKSPTSGTMSTEWDGRYSDPKGSWAIRTSTEYESFRIKNWNGKMKSQGTKTHSGSGTSFTINEDTEIVNKNDSYTRLTRFRNIGPMGKSDWQYCYHVYAKPNQADIIKAKTTIDSLRGISPSEVEWTLAYSWNKRPVDQGGVRVTYKIGVPGAGMGTPTDSGGWEMIQTASPSSKGEVNFDIPQTIPDDNCVWIRIETKHDEDISYSKAVRSYTGKIKEPSISSVNASGNNLIVEVENKSEVPDAYVNVYLVTGSSMTQIGKIPHGSSTGTFTVDDLPALQEYSIAVQSSNDVMTSNVVTSSSSSSTIPSPPKSLYVEQYSDDTVNLTWDPNWTYANQSIVSWSNNPNAWDSTEQPQTHTITEKRNQFYISKLEVGTTYYFRVKNKYVTDEQDVGSIWSDPVSITLTSVPVAPVLSAASTSVMANDVITCSITTEATKYTTEIAEVVNGELVKIDGTPVILISGASGSDLSASIGTINAIYRAYGLIDKEWIAGSTHVLVARTITENGGISKLWSNPVTISVVEITEIANLTVNVATVAISEEGEEGVVTTRNIDCIIKLPITVTAETNIPCDYTVRLLRDEDYHFATPNGRHDSKFGNELIALETYQGQSSIETSFDSNDFLGSVDDRIYYKVIVNAIDGYGRIVSAEKRFLIHWEHQPELPIVAEADDQVNLVATVSVSKPTGWLEGDTFDVYRLSTDIPQLILSNGTYETIYVDKYPAFGENGGYRVVNKSLYGDYVDDNFTITMTDVEANIDEHAIVIDYDGNRIRLPYDINIQSSWQKDFKRTSYLGGSVQGDWNKATTRNLQISTTLFIDDNDIIMQMRNLADYPGICHIRTPDGSSFACDIQITEQKSSTGGQAPVIPFTLAVKRVDAESDEMLTLSQWNEEQI